MTLNDAFLYAPVHTKDCINNGFHFVEKCFIYESNAFSLLLLFTEKARLVEEGR